jgi:hypothetical protein
LENNVQKLLLENKNLKDINTNLMNEKQSLSQLKNDINNNNIINSNNNSDKNNINNEKVIQLQKQINELIQYKNKCNYLDKNIFQLKTELKKIKQEKDLLTILVNNMKSKKDNNDDNSNNNLDNKKDIKENKYTNIRICNNQSITYKMINNIDYDRGSNININKIQESDKEKEMLKTKNKDLEKNINMIQKKYDDLLKENNKLETKKNELIQQVNDLNDLIDLSNKDLVAKILDLKKVIEVLHKQIESEINKKNSLENKLLSLQQKMNQMDEPNEKDKDEAAKQSLYRESKGIIINNNNINLNESNADSFNLDSYKNQIINLKNENSSLIKTINNLKNEIKSYKAKIRRPSSKRIDEKLLESIKDTNDEDLIKNMAEEMNKWKQEYYKLSKVNDLLKENIAKLEKNIGVGEEISYLKEALAKKDELLMNLTLQIKEYQSQSDDIIIGNTNKSKDKQIEILLKEVKGIRKRLLNMITLNDRITEFEDFMNNIKIIQELENKAKDKNVKKAFEQLNALIEVYKLNNDMAYNDFIVKLFMLE